MNGSARNTILGSFIKRLCLPHKALIPQQPEKCLFSQNSNGVKLLDEKFGKRFLEGPTLHDFMNSDGGHGHSLQVPDIPYLEYNKFKNNDRKGRPTIHFIEYLKL